MCANADRRPCAGFTLIELMIVMAVMAGLTALIISTLAMARTRLRAATAAADARAELQLARSRLLADIHVARTATVGAGGRELRLALSNSREVIWRLEGGRLVRATGGLVKIWSAPVAGAEFRAASGGAATCFVEAAIKVPGTKGPSGGRTIYVAGRTRIAEEKP